MKKNLLLLCIGLISSASLAFAMAPPPGVSFNVSTSNGCAPLLVTFTNTSSAGNYYVWDFQDGSQIMTVNATHTFNRNGNFNVMLTAYDTLGGGMVMKGQTQQNINVNGVNLNTSADSVCPGEMFTAYVNPNGSNFQWSFGDGATSNQQNASHTYTSPGIDTLKLTVNNNCGGIQHLSQVVYVKNGAHPSASFGSSVGGGSGVCPHDNIQFYPRSQSASSYSWTFGDGGTSSQAQPTYSYSSAGKYTVKLTVTSSCGTSSTYADTVHVNGNIYFPNYLNINSSGSQGCPHDMFNFSTNGAPALGMVWKFGTSDSLMGPNVSYAWSTAGTYTVTCHLHNGCNNDTTLSTVIHVKSNLPYTGNVQTQFSPNPVCPNDQVSFQSNSASAYKWYFGDAGNDSSSLAQPTFVYPSVGTYTVTLKLYNGCGRDTAVKNILTVNNSSFPMLGHNNNGNWGATSTATCPGDTAAFFAQTSGSLHWNFGDGHTANGGAAIQTGGGTVYIMQHAFTTNGTYWVKLTATNGCGNSTTDSLQYMVGGSTPVNGSLNIAGTSHNNNIESANACQKLQFIGGGGSTYKWFFGNGDSIITHSTSTNYSYPAPGIYTIVLKIKNGCGDTATITKAIEIDGINPSVTPTNLMCNGLSSGKIVIAATGGYPSYNYSLNGGSYQLSNTFNNLTAGSYTITTRDSMGCMVMSNVTLNQPSALVITPSSVSSTCGNSNGSASVSMSGGTPAYTYSWQAGGSTSSVINKPSGSYLVTITDANGCSVNTSIAINDVGGPTVTYPGTLSGSCISASSYSLTGGTPAGGTYSGAGVSGGAFFNPAAAGAGTHTIVYTYSNGTCSSSASNTITVHALPHVTAGANPANGQVCTGGSLTLTGGGATTYSWSGSVSNGVPFVPGGPATYTVTGTDANNCTATATIAIAVNPYPVVSLSFTGQDTLGDCKTNVALTGGSPAGGTYTGTGVVGADFQPSAVGDGTYTITYTFTNASGCTASQSKAIHVLPCPLGIQELTSLSLKLYPNPSNGLFTLETPEIGGVLQVLNAIGQVIHSEKVTQTSSVLDLQSQVSGIYLVKIESAKGVAIQRILIAK